MGVALFNAAATVGGALGPFVVGACVHHTGSFVSAMVIMGAFLAAAGLMMAGLGVYIRVKQGSREQRIPAARDGSGACTSTTDLLSSGVRLSDKDSAAVDVEMAAQQRVLP